MSIFKCKMCGGDIHAEAGAAFGTCDSCGTTSTLPKASDERLVNLFNRANHFRMINDFDKALSVYENLLNEDDTNAEAHWCAALCRYGIEYVEDPATRERIPTCHRAQFDPILKDADYLAALENASDGYARQLYEDEAKKISEIQKQLLAISNNEEPYDIFICYKESTDGGSRTRDSILAQDIYFRLTNEKWRVFFSRISLEDKLGREYEPYIFSALNSAKVMLVIGTKKEHFEAVWVRNEWSRFLALTKKDRSRLIIPCYQEMDAYDLPDELSMLQSQDMSKIGFIQDLVRGIGKVLAPVKAQSAPSAAPSAVQTADASGLVKRAFIILEDGEWGKADALLEQALNVNPEDAQAYVGKLLAELHIRKEESLKDHNAPLTHYGSFVKASRFADERYRAVLNGYNETVTERLAEQERIRLEKEREEEETRLAAQKFLEEEDRKRREQELARENERRRIAAEKAARQKAFIGKIVKRVVIPAAVLIAAIAVYINVGIPMRYDYAKKLSESDLSEADDYMKVARAYEALGDYEDSDFYADLYHYYAYDSAESLLNAGEHKAAEEIFKELGDFSSDDYNPRYYSYPSSDEMEKIARERPATEKKFNSIVALFDEGNFEEALNSFEEFASESEDRFYVNRANDYIGHEPAYDYPYDEAGNLREDADKDADREERLRRAADVALNPPVAVSDGIAAGIDTNSSLVHNGRMVADFTGWDNLTSVYMGNEIIAAIGEDRKVKLTYGGEHEGSYEDFLERQPDDALNEANGWTDICAVTVNRGDSSYSGDYDYIVGLKEDGSLVATGSFYYNQDIALGTWRDIISVASYGDNIVGLKSNGTLLLAGSSYSSIGSASALRSEISEWKNICQVAIGDGVIYGLDADGKLFCAGGGEYHDATQALIDGYSGPGFAAVYTDGDSLYAVREDGSVWYSSEGSAGVIPDAQGVAALAVDTYSIAMLSEDGRCVYALGDADSGSWELKMPTSN